MLLSATVDAMEAAVADREAEMTEWNEGRLDELSKRVDDGFAHMRDEFARVNQRIDGVDGNLRSLVERFDAMQRTLMQVGGGILVALIGLIATLIGLLATQI
jgi:hypothetical protein